ncbi:MAG: hypothetical protein F4X54_06745 [Chloroflexi bacterium]|nr:hypothetical protein [Chloroflexota bacterium]
MTTRENVAEHDPPTEQGEARSWDAIAVSFAGRIAQLAQHRRGDLAELRRMDPEAPNAAVFWRLLAEEDLLCHGSAVERKWALVLHGIALMTPTNVGDGDARTAHNGYMPVGRALFLGREVQPASGFYSETRLNRLLTAREEMLRTLLARMFRMLAAGSVSFNWREMARFIFNDGYDEVAAEEARRRIARAYYQAERHNASASIDQDN